MIDKHPLRYKRRRVLTSPALLRLLTLSLFSNTPRLPIFLTLKLKMKKRSVKLQGVGCSISHPYYLFIGGSQGVMHQRSVAELHQTDISNHSWSDMWKIEVVGPTGCSTDQGGQPAWPSGQPPPSCPGRLLLGPTCHFHVQAHCPKSVSCSGGPFNPCDDTC